MAGKNTAVYGIYSNRATAETAVNQFLSIRFFQRRRLSPDVGHQEHQRLRR